MRGTIAAVTVMLSFLSAGLSQLPPATSQDEKPAYDSGRLSSQPDSVSVTAAKLSKPYGSHLAPIFKKIGASQDQRKQITQVVMSYKPRLEPLRQEYRQKSQEFLDLIITGRPAEQVMTQQGELNRLYSVIVTQYSLMRLEIRKVLTPEQLKKFEQYRREQGWTSAR